MKNLKSRMYFFTAGLLLTVSLLSAAFGIMMYRTNLMDTYSNVMRAGLTDTMQKIQYGVSFGKDIENYFGVETLLNETLENSVYADNLYITGKGNRLLSHVGNGRTSEEVLAMEAGTRKIARGQFYAAFPLTEDSLLIAQMGVESIEKQQQDFAGNLLSVAAIGFFFIMAFISVRWSRASRRDSFRMLPLFIVVIWIVALGIYVGVMCWQEYMASQELLASVIEQSVLNDIKRLADQGIPYEQLMDVDGYLNLYLDSIPEFEKLSLVNGSLEYKVSSNHMWSVFVQYVLNTLLLSIISILIVVEYQFFLGMRKKQAVQRESEQVHRTVRITIFCLYACISIGKTMNVVVSNKLALKMEGKSADILTSVPASMAMLGAVVGILLSKWILKRCGNLYRYFLVISIGGIAGLVVSSFSGHLYLFASARAVLGFCEGLLLIGIRNYAFCFTDSRERTHVLSYVTGGGFGGICLGSVMGGMLYDHLSYQWVFIIAAAGIVGVIPLACKIRFSMEMVGKESASPAALLAVLKNAAAVRFILFLVFPVYAAAIFLDYLLPLAGETFGFSHTAVSALILANCLLAGYAAPFMTRMTMKLMSPIKGSILYCALYGSLILAYALTENSFMLILVVLALGLCDSFGLMMLAEAFLSTKRNYMYEDSEANIMFTISSRAGQLIAPLCTAWYGNSVILAGMIGVGMGAYAVTAYGGRKDKNRTNGNN